jgi:fatty-acid desaturase
MFKAYHSVKLLKTVQMIGFISFFAGWFFIDFYALAILFCFLFGVLGQGIGLHRYFSHKSFETGYIRHRLLILFSVLSTTGSILHYAAGHRYHHAKSDTEQDIHSPHYGSWIHAFFSWFDKDKLKNIPLIYMKNLVRDKNIVFSHNWSWHIIILYNFVLFMIDPRLVIACYLIPVGYTRFSGGIQSMLLHMNIRWINYRNYEVKDQSHNSWLFNILTFGEGYHNNHHRKPNDYNFAHRWYEFDPTAMVIRTCFADNKIVDTTE